MRKKILIFILLIIPTLLFSNDDFNSKMKSYIGKKIQVINSIVGGEHLRINIIEGILDHVGEDYLVIRRINEDKKGKKTEYHTIVPKDKIIEVYILEQLKTEK